MNIPVPHVCSGKTIQRLDPFPLCLQSMMPVTVLARWANPSYGPRRAVLLQDSDPTFDHATCASYQMCRYRVDPAASIAAKQYMYLSFDRTMKHYRHGVVGMRSAMHVPLGRSISIGQHKIGYSTLPRHITVEPISQVEHT